jgi:hypothetical protein
MPQFKRLVTTKHPHINGKENFNGAKTDEALLLRFREPAITKARDRRGAQRKKRMERRLKRISQTD